MSNPFELPDDPDKYSDGMEYLYKLPPGSLYRDAKSLTLEPWDRPGWEPWRMWYEGGAAEGPEPPLLRVDMGKFSISGTQVYSSRVQSNVREAATGIPTGVQSPVYGTEVVPPPAKTHPDGRAVYFYEMSSADRVPLAERVRPKPKQ